MADVLFTTTQGIRAAIGVSDIEILDSQIIDLDVQDQLEIYLTDAYPDYQAIATANQPGGTPTPEQAALWRALKLVCKYEGAIIVLQAGQNLLAQTVTEGGVTTARFAKDDITTLLARLEARRDRFLSVLTDEDPVAFFMVSPLVRVQPSYDPVTGCYR